MKLASKPIGIVIGASGGIGRALVDALRARSDIGAVVALSRQASDLDLGDEASIARAAEAVVSEHGSSPASIIFNATGVLDVNGAGPEKSFASLSAPDMQAVFSVNTFGAALALKHFLPLLVRDGPARFGALSARVGSIGDNRLGGWMSYRASKAALNQIVRCAAIEHARVNKRSVVAALHPGTIETELTRKFARGNYTATPESAAEQLINVLINLTPEQSGGFYAYDSSELVW